MISACMIVRDEAKVLDRCLTSIKDWVDEIIVIDTGSTDDTIKIAKSFGAKVFKQNWTEHFSYHRNYSMSKATKDWIFIIDADEEVPVEDGDTMKRMLADGIKYDVICVDVLNLYGEEKKIARTKLPMFRFFRRSYKPKYKGFVHNRPVIKADTTIYRLPFRILHYGYDLDRETAEKKYNRTVVMCRKATEDTPEDAVMWLHYARSLKVREGGYDFKQVPEMERALLTGIDLCGGKNDWQNTLIQLLSFMSLVRYMKKNYVEAAKFAELALSYKPDFIDCMYLAGMAYTYGIDAIKGEKYMRQYLVEQEIYDFSGKVDSLVMEYANVRATVYKALSDVEDWKDKQALIIPVVEKQEVLVSA